MVRCRLPSRICNFPVRVCLREYGTISLRKSCSGFRWQCRHFTTKAFKTVERALKAHLLDGKFEGTTLQRSKSMQAVQGKDNRTTERRLRLGLVRAGIRGWKIRPKGLIGNPDFFFPAQSLAIFVDGCFWHGCPICGHLPRANSAFWKEKIGRNRERDAKTSSRLTEHGFRVVRFWEHQLQNELEQCINELR